MGRRIPVSDKYVNAFFTMTGIPLTNEEVVTYISSSETKTFLADILNNHTDKKLSEIVEKGIREEFFDSYGAKAQKMWESISE